MRIVRLDRRRIEGLLDKKKKKKEKKKKKKKKTGKREKQRREGVIDRERSSVVLRCPYLI